MAVWFAFEGCYPDLRACVCVCAGVRRAGSVCRRTKLIGFES